jgi:hypothetical protein
VVTILLGTISATPVEMDLKELAERGKYDPAIAFATWTDGSCSSGQVDYHKPDGTCNTLPGQSMKIWWLASGCRSTSSPHPSRLLSIQKTPYLMYCQCCWATVLIRSTRTGATSRTTVSPLETSTDTRSTAEWCEWNFGLDSSLRLFSQALISRFSLVLGVGRRSLVH